MKKNLLGFLFLISISAFSQKNIQISTQHKVLGKNLIDNSDITGLEITFPDRIHETYLDTITELLTVQLRGVSKNGEWLNNNGYILQYDLKNQMLLWNKKIAYQTSDLQQFSQTMIFRVGNKSNLLDVNTGKNLRQIKNSIYMVDPVDNIGIGYKSTVSTSNTVEGIDLRNGKVLWKREINRDYGWNDVFYTNDSTIIVVASGLHAINIFNGKGWDYSAITGKKDYSGTIGANAIGIAAGLLTGAFVVTTGHDLVRNVVSNTLTDSSFIYFASREQLVKIDKESGNIAWLVHLPKDVGSKSSIFIEDNTVFMINKGTAFMGERQLFFGTPFLAAFGRQTGEQKYLNLIDVKKDPILDFQSFGNEIYLIFKNRIEKYSKETGDMIMLKEFPEEAFSGLRFIAGNQVFVADPKDNLVGLSKTDSTKMFVFTDQGKALAINSQLYVTDMFDFEDLSICYLRTKDYKLIADENKTLIVNNEGRKIAEVGVSSDAFVIDNVLYGKKENNFIMIDLKDIIKAGKTIFTE